MKKSLLKNGVLVLVTVCLSALLSVSCSSSDEDEPAKDPDVVITKFDVNKTEAFVDQKIQIELDGNGYTDLVVTSSNSAVVITKIAATVFEISSTKAASSYIYVAMSNKTKSTSKGITVNFSEHGVLNFNTVEGIKVDVDKSAKVLALLGEPDKKSDSSDGLSDIWVYGSKGFSVFISKKTTIVNQIDMMSSNYYYFNNDNVKVNYTTYPYEIGNSWKINSTTMDLVITQFGLPTSKSTSTTSATLRTYQYASQRLVFRFYSDSEDNYTGKKIIYFSVY